MTPALVDVGGRFMTSAELGEAAAALGMRREALYFRGRIGAVGEVGAPVATCLLGIFPAPVVELTWEASQRLPAEAAAASYAGACAQWGRVNLAAFAAASTVATLAETVCDAADASALPLFAAWREMSRPADPSARAAFALMLLRELRGAVHFAALRAHGLDVPLAVLGDPFGGPARLRRIAWPDQLIADLTDRAAGRPDLAATWAAGEAATDARYAELCSVLPADSRRTLAEGIAEAERSTRPG